MPPRDTGNRYGKFYDCDGDTLLVKVEQTGAACHEGTFSCFSRKFGDADPTVGERPETPETVLPGLYRVIQGRRQNPKETLSWGFFPAHSPPPPGSTS